MTPEQAAAVLELERPWTLNSLKSAYRSKTRETHPDRGGSEAAFVEVYEAREVIASWLQDNIEPPPVVESEPLNIGDTLPIVGLRCNGIVHMEGMHARLIELSEKGSDPFGETLTKQLMIEITFARPVQLGATVVEIVLLDEPDAAPDVIVRDIQQRSVDDNENVRAIWVNAARVPVVTKAYTRSFFWWG